MPETGWLNDPNGLCQLDGQYHIYYQYTPFEPTGEIKLWGHYTTKDFVRYTRGEPALFPDTDLDAHGVYSVKTRRFAFLTIFFWNIYVKNLFLHQKFFLPFNLDCEDCF